jgi:2',3'-cyclic-nucleotide 2'-phosphodiesterase (5'-nucleotidase family)
MASTLLAAQPELVVIHWNDFHSNNLPYQISRPEPGYLVGGYAYLAGYVDSLRRIYPQALLLDAGDEFQGSPISNLTKGLSQILILNRLKIHAFVPGNHEFDYGFDNLRTVLEQAQFPIITTNYYDSTKMELLSRPYIVYRTGGLKVAILGIGWSDLKSSMLASNASGLGILDPVTSIKQWVARLQQSVDIIVVLSHSGFEEDSLLATQLEEVDVIIGGHSHTILRQPRVVNNILICQAGSNGRYVGLLRGKVDPEHNRLLDYRYELLETRHERIKPYLPVALLVDSLENSIKSKMDEVIGELVTDWRRNSDGESNIGDWLCDVTREYFKVDIALMNSGGIRKNLKAGPIRVRDIWEIMPFDNTVVKFKVTGRQLWQMLQYRLENPRDFLQVSGLKYTYDGKKQKLLTVAVGDQPLQEQANYWIATNNFVISQFERFFGLKSMEVELLATEVVLRDVLLQAVRQQKVIDSRVNGRIVEINQP